MSNLNCLLHPHHVSLVSQPHTFQAFYKSFSDRVNSYHDHNRVMSHDNVFAPQFNVVETETSYVLDGEVPGVGDQRSIHVVWLQNQVLAINRCVESLKTREAVTTGQEDADNEWVQSNGKHSPVSISHQQRPEYMQRWK